MAIETRLLIGRLSEIGAEPRRGNRTYFKISGTVEMNVAGKTCGS